jgi:hypothetical protein
MVMTHDFSRYESIPNRSQNAAPLVRDIYLGKQAAAWY